jgi:hypothetical protein
LGRKKQRILNFVHKSSLDKTTFQTKNQKTPRPNDLAAPRARVLRGSLSASAFQGRNFMQWRRWSARRLFENYFHQ